jgi:hypothetical protein
MEPDPITDPRHRAALKELMKLEPLFHRLPPGITPRDFERMLAPEFWEIGASGRRYSRDYVLEVLAERLENPVDDVWKTRDFHCLEIAANNYLITYTLLQGVRVTRRASIWRHTAHGWRVVFHQGTLVQEE